ncbi:MAG TPA: hypothetical protein V6D19_25855, partial [Stenomitos sp.]
QDAQAPNVRSCWIGPLEQAVDSESLRATIHRGFRWYLHASPKADKIPQKYQYLIEDLFQTVTLYNNKAESATLKKRADGKFDVTLNLSMQKVRSDNNGNETPVAMSDEIDVGVYDTAGKLIYLKKHQLKEGDTALAIAVDKLPQTAGIDPLHKLIDQVPDDNVINISGAVK